MDDRHLLAGERIRLRTTVRGDRDALVAIRSTREVRRRWRGDDLAAEFVADLAESAVHRLTIVVPAGGDDEIDDSADRVVGMIQFAEDPDPDYRHASIDLYVDPAMHRRGIATDAIRTLVDHLFDERGHHRITIDPVADNLGAIECYRKVGFRPVGVMRAYERQADGTWADGLLMELLATDPRTGRPSDSG